MAKLLNYFFNLLNEIRKLERKSTVKSK